MAGDIAALIAVGGHDITMDGVSVSDSRTGVRIERGGEAVQDTAHDVQRKM